MKKNSKTALMAAAFAAAMSFSACHSFDDYTTVYGPPPDTGETQPVQTSEQVTETVIPRTEEPRSESLGTTASGVASTDTGTSDGTTTGSGTLTETSAPEGDDTVTTAAAFAVVPSAAIELPTVYDPDKQHIQLVYGPPSYES